MGWEYFFNDYMSRPLLMRGLRIAWSMWWGILCALLVVLWVRSYWWADSFRYGRSSHVVELDSKDSRLYLRGSTTGGAALQPYLRPHRQVDADLFSRINASASPMGFGMYVDVALINTSTLIAPHWFPVFVAGAFAVVPWIHWTKRFSLRTLLIATTLIAVVLGLVVWSSAR
jgi:hypothetical protein